MGSEETSPSGDRDPVAFAPRAAIAQATSYLRGALTS
jgi:hypothetical protein